MPANFIDSLSSRTKQVCRPRYFGLGFLNSKCKSTGIFIALISFSSLANANCSETLLNKLIDNQFSTTQIMELCGKSASQPPTGETIAAGDAKAATPPQTPAAPPTPAPPKAAAAPKAAADSTDPLNLKETVRIVPMTDIKYKENAQDITIPHGTATHYSKNDEATYTLFTDSSPCSAWLPKSTDSCAQEANKTFPDIPIDALKNKIAVSRWSTGILIVPYKYGLSNHSLAQGSVTIGPYAGYTVDWLGSEWTFPFTAGITKVSVPSIQNGVATSTEKAGLSIATGILFNPGGKINTGVLIGVDQLGSNSGYKDNGKPWLGVYVGAGF